MMRDEDVRARLSGGADALRFDADAQLERLLRSRGRRAAIRRGTTIAVALVIAILGASIAWIARPGGSDRISPATDEPTGTIAYMRLTGNGDTAEVVTAPMIDPSPWRLGVGRFSVYPVWSPDGSMIAFGSGKDYDTTELTVASADGSEPRALADRPLRGTVSWSPDAKEIAYVGDSDIGSPVYVVNADGTDDHEVVDGWWTSVSWSPDGSTLLLSGHPATDTNSYTEDGYDLYTVGVDGSALERVIARRGYEHFGAWSPDGTEILFTSGPSYDDADYHSDVYVMNADGSNIRRLTTWDGFDSFPTWSPDGRWIAFASDRNATPGQQRANEQGDAFANFSIFAMRPDGTDVREVIPAREGEILLPGSWRA
jgi:Tol biopolymer transport system component